MKRRTLAAGLAGAFVLAACGREGSREAGKPAAAAAPVSLDVVAAEARGFNVGSTMSTRVAYVFFDPQCPHCAALWEAARPLRSQARFVWIPVSLLNDKSAPQGAAILGAPDPVAAMDEHEKSLRGQQGGIAAMGAPDAQKEAVRKNTELFNRFGFASVPTVVAKHAQSGDLVTIEGSVATGVLASRLGLNPPA
ncbi:thioredoxin fold domain-containing protein [Ramlibacter pallidus]|uniref:Thioredoxin fold domain-containing protein n=1 Tax=Ramlibacter pallidus TaxID=2780087 RepID=A0ABR9S5G1_9BURK|nr:thioredoxin fold domain-containing protein [Ramlibacter pallidus]MBE7368716.1 thioredoxin fold domain-containing protein [Ramlibacter pallidus]